MRSRGASPALLHAACCHEHRYSTPNVPPAGLCSGSWCQVCWDPPFSLLIVRFKAIDRLAKILEQLLQTPHGTLMSLDLPLPAMATCILHQFQLSFAPPPQAGGVLWRGDKLGAGQVEVTFTWPFLWET